MSTLLWGEGDSTTRTISIGTVLNLLAMGMASIAGLLVARILGPSTVGEYAAITAWFGVALVAGELGQPAAICYYVAHDPRRARHYVATSRNLMLMTGIVMAVIGWVLAAVLTNGGSGVTAGYRIAFIVCPVTYVGASFLFAIQARSIRAWMITRASQPALFLAACVGLVALHRLTLISVIAAMSLTLAAQALLAAELCKPLGLRGGRSMSRLRSKLLRYGVSQVLATTPTTLNVSLDQLILSQAVRSADLGYYAIAVSLTSLAYPFVTPIGSVLFPRLAAQRRMTAETRDVIVKAILATVFLSSVLMGALAAVAPWGIPFVFGHAFRPSIALTWILCPGGVFLGSNQVIGDLLRGQNRTTLVAYAQGIALVATVALLVTLIPIIGVTGAAVASSASYALAFMILTVAVLRPVRGAAGAVEVGPSPLPAPSPAPSMQPPGVP